MLARNAFETILQCEGREFGGKKLRTGISDGNNGVQWNLVIDRNTDEIRVGVNLEGMRYNKRYVIADFISNELREPRVLYSCQSLVTDTPVFIRMMRDAWQKAGRHNIREKFIGSEDMRPSGLTEGQWAEILSEAYDCLDPKTRQGRGEQQVTVVKKDGSEVRRVMEVTPHLHISVIPWFTEPESELESRLSMAGAISLLLPVHAAVARQCVCVDS